jgi:hypothetical protein
MRIAPDMTTHVLLYGPNIGAHRSPLSYPSAAEALRKRYPAEDRAIELAMIDYAGEEHDEEFWRTEQRNLTRKFGQRVSPFLADGTIRHLSVFARGPQPLLIKLGSILTDIPSVEVYQLHREPQDWKWHAHPSRFRFILEQPKQVAGPPALVLALSANLSEKRITAVIGEHVTIWRVTIEDPNNDFLKSKKQLRQFRELARRLMVQIKDAHGQDAILNVFPAVPAAVAVELGRIRQPKADLRWRVFDHLNNRGGFVPALEIC